MKEKLVEYINLRIQQEGELEQYKKLLGESLSIYDVLYETNEYIEKSLGITGDMADYIDDYAVTKAVHGWVPSPDSYDYWYKEVRSVEDLAEYLIFYKAKEAAA